MSDFDLSDSVSLSSLSSNNSLNWSEEQRLILHLKALETSSPKKFDTKEEEKLYLQQFKPINEMTARPTILLSRPKPPKREKISLLCPVIYDGLSKIFSRNMMLFAKDYPSEGSPLRLTNIVRTRIYEWVMQGYIIPNKTNSTTLSHLMMTFIESDFKMNVKKGLTAFNRIIFSGYVQINDFLRSRLLNTFKEIMMHNENEDLKSLIANIMNPFLFNCVNDVSEEHTNIAIILFSGLMETNPLIQKKILEIVYKISSNDEVFKTKFGKSAFFKLVHHLFKEMEAEIVIIILKIYGVYTEEPEEAKRLFPQINQTRVLELFGSKNTKIRNECIVLYRNYTVLPNSINTLIQYGIIKSIIDECNKEESNNKD